MSVVHYTIAAGETRELVLINETNMDWHVVLCCVCICYICRKMRLMRSGNPR